MTIYRPDKPYIFQSGKRKGKCAEILMFREYPFLVWQLWKMNEEHRGGEKNKLHRHLEWLLAKGETRQTKMFCSFCKEKLVEFFSVYTTTEGTGLYWQLGPAICGNCIGALKRNRPENVPSIWPITFRYFSDYKGRIARSKIITYLKTIFDLPRLTAQTAFDFFNAPP